MKRFQLNGKYDFCPNGNYWQEVSGIFDERVYLFCDCNKCKGKVYELRPFDVTKKIDKATIDRIRNINKLDEVRDKITIKNMDKVLQSLKDK